MANFRRSQRYPFRLDIVLEGSHHKIPTTSEDVSFHGVFIRNDEERAPNQIVKFVVVDPRNGEPVELLGIVARCVSQAEAAVNRPPGIGLSLFGNDRATEARWVAIMRQVKLWVELGHRAAPPLGTESHAPDLGAEGQSTLVGLPRPTVPMPTPLPAVAARPAPPAPPPPPPERRPAKFNVTLRPDGIATLQQFELKDISEGGTFVLTPTLIPPGSRVNLRLVHPQSGETFQIAGLVARAVDSLDESEKGIAIKFDADAVDRREWVEFVGQLAPARRDLPPSVPPPPPPGVRVLRASGAPPAADPPILLDVGEVPLHDAARMERGASNPDLPPVILDGRERSVPVRCGPGVNPPPRKP